MTRTEIEPPQPRPAAQALVPSPGVPYGDTGYVSVLRSAARHPLLVLLPILLFAGAALYLSLARDPQYTAKAQLEVGRLNVTSPGALAGFPPATQALATAYSRSVDADDVIAPAAERLRLPARELRGRVSASPVEQSPVFFVSARAPSETEAVRAANVVSTSLISTITRRNRDNPDARRLNTRFREAAATLSRARTRATAATRRFRNARSDANREALERARAQQSVAQLEADALRDAYSSAQQSQSYTAPVSMLARATEAPSDRVRRAQLMVFVALLAGGAIGLALATLRANRLRHAA